MGRTEQWGIHKGYIFDWNILQQLPQPHNGLLYHGTKSMFYYNFDKPTLHKYSKEYTEKE
jgi:hypothetical protein